MAGTEIAIDELDSTHIESAEFGCWSLHDSDGCLEDVMGLFRTFAVLFGNSLFALGCSDTGGGGILPLSM